MPASKKGKSKQMSVTSKSEKSKQMSDTGRKRLGALINRLREFKNYKQIDSTILRQVEERIKQDVKNASDQGRYVLRLIDNAKTNAG